MSKRALRSVFLERRKNLSTRIVKRKSNKIQETLLTIKPLISARTAGFYYPVNNEVDLTGIFNDLVSRGVEIYFPRVSGSQLVFCKTERLSQLRPGSFNVPEPEFDNNIIDTTDLDVILVPGLVFDRDGNRIGYGRGYYDRTIKGIERPRLIGICYEFQLVSSLPAEIHDRSVGAIVTEKGYTMCEKGRRQ